MLTILEQSERGKLRGYRTHKWQSSNILSNTLTETFWSVRTNFRKFTFIEYLQMKELLIGLPKIEQRCLFDAPGVMTDDLFVAALKAKTLGVDHNTLWQRLGRLQRLLGHRTWVPNLVYTLDNCVNYEIEEQRRSIRKVKKYSGYVRNSSAVGSKRKTSIVRPDPESFEWCSDVEIDYFNYLSVGELSSGMPGSIVILTSLK